MKSTQYPQAQDIQSQILKGIKIVDDANDISSAYICFNLTKDNYLRQRGGSKFNYYTNSKYFEFKGMHCWDNYGEEWFLLIRNDGNVFLGSKYDSTSFACNNFFFTQGTSKIAYSADEIQLFWKSCVAQTNHVKLIENIYNNKIYAHGFKDFIFELTIIKGAKPYIEIRLLVMIAGAEANTLSYFIDCFGCKDIQIINGMMILCGIEQSVLLSNPIIADNEYFPPDWAKTVGTETYIELKNNIVLFSDVWLFNNCPISYTVIFPEEILTVREHQGLWYFFGRENIYVYQTNLFTGYDRKLIVKLPLQSFSALTPVETLYGLIQIAKNGIYLLAGGEYKKISEPINILFQKNNILNLDTYAVKKIDESCNSVNFEINLLEQCSSCYDSVLNKFYFNVPDNFIIELDLNNQEYYMHIQKREGYYSTELTDTSVAHSFIGNKQLFYFKNKIYGFNPQGITELFLQDYFKDEYLIRRPPGDYSLLTANVITLWISNNLYMQPFSEIENTMLAIMLIAYGKNLSGDTLHIYCYNEKQFFLTAPSYVDDFTNNVFYKKWNDKVFDDTNSKFDSSYFQENIIQFFNYHVHQSFGGQLFRIILQNVTGKNIFAFHSIALLPQIGEDEKQINPAI